MRLLCDNPSSDFRRGSLTNKREGSACDSGECGENVNIDKLSLSSERLKLYDGEFDPGSERTLAARFKHASRTVIWSSDHMRVANG